MGVFLLLDWPVACRSPLADAAGSSAGFANMVRQAHLSLLESGGQGPTVEMVSRIADALNVPVELLLLVVDLLSVLNISFNLPNEH